jgi:hypothetical protein
VSPASSSKPKAKARRHEHGRSDLKSASSNQRCIESPCRYVRAAEKLRPNDILSQLWESKCGECDNALQAISVEVCLDAAVRKC